MVVKIFLIILAIYLATVVLAWYQTREYILRCALRKVKNHVDAFVIFMMLCPILNLIFAVALYFDCREEGFFIKKLFHVNIGGEEDDI